jgi:predicted RNA-binding Zn ribbon-like protein
VTDPPAWCHDVVGGRLCLDLANTIGGMRGHETGEHLAAYPDLVAWAVRTCVLDAQRARKLLAEARRRPADAARVLADAHAIREAIHAVVSARIDGREPRRADVEVLNGALVRALPHRRLARRDGGFVLEWEDDPAALDAPLWPVAHSVADLLTSDRDLSRVRVCGEAEQGRCGWLFVDETKSGTRRWCSMRDCGNRAKARRHYQRARGG